LKRGNKYALQVADADGYNAQSIIEYTEPIISPAWSPDGKQLAYVSFENKKPIVYVQTLSTRERRAVASFKGSNSAPSWSPDGKTIGCCIDWPRRIADIPDQCRWQWFAKVEPKFRDRYGT
jgi:TolB protein